MNPQNPVQPETPVATPPQAPVSPQQPVASPPPPQATPPLSPQSNTKLPIVIICIFLALLVVGGVVALVLLKSGHDNLGDSLGVSAPETYDTYTNDQFKIQFKYPSSWGNVTLSQTTGKQGDETGVSSYNATFSHKSGGTDSGGTANPYLFRINSYKYGVPEDSEGNTSNQPSLTYRTTSTTDTSHPEILAGFTTCQRTDSDSETCGLFSNTGDFTLINGATLAKAASGDGVGLFVPLAEYSGNNYTMASFYSASVSDYSEFQKIAESFTGQLR